MHDAADLCPDCGTRYESSDNYCRNCGMYLAALRPTLPIAIEPTETAVAEVQRPPLPAPVRRAATALAIGAAIQVGVGLAGRYLAGQAAREAARAATTPARRGAKAAPRRKDDELPLAAVTETVVVRRVWMRRD